ncbi:MAG: TlpA disulfide reductase family protein, partial [Candidatus Omnitrophota bacterium]|nr:TlpA disulfide reductase family protein [Candidatus Omnitrophota bacterium]
IQLFLMGIFFLGGCSSALENTDKKAPDFLLRDINNKTVRLSDYGNKVIILNFFATWCRPCRTEIPDFIEIMNDYGDKNLAIIGISLDRGRVETVVNFAKKFNINYPILTNGGPVSDIYGPIRSIPTTFIIDKNGNIARKIIGSRNKLEFEKIIKPLL